MCCQIHTSLLSNNSLLSHCQTSSFLVCYLICFTLLLPKPLIIILSLSFLCFYFFLSFSPLRLLPLFFFPIFFPFYIGFLSLVSILLLLLPFFYFLFFFSHWVSRFGFYYYYYYYYFLFFPFHWVWFLFSFLGC